MNKVTELLRLVPGASIDDAVARLSILFDLMSRAPGFRDAEVLRKADDPDLLLVLHTWDDIEDWHTFQVSDTKIAFSASRPAFLYAFVPCGINWQLKAGECELRDGDLVRREVIVESLEPREGPEVIASQTFAYQDYEPSLEGAMLRLTRLHTAPTSLRLPESCILTDELYESVHKRPPAAVAIDHVEMTR